MLLIQPLLLCLELLLPPVLGQQLHLVLQQLHLLLQALPETLQILLLLGTDLFRCHLKKNSSIFNKVVVGYHNKLVIK